jgi:integrase
MVRSIFRDAVLDRLGAENPAARVTLRSFEKPLVVPLTVEQIEALEDAIDDRCRAMVIVQAGAGLRIGELLALRVEDVNFLRKTIRVQWQFAGTDSKVRTEPKTPRSKRVVPVPQFVIDAVADHLRKYSPGDDGTLFITELRAAECGGTISTSRSASRLPCEPLDCRSQQRRMIFVTPTPVFCSQRANRSRRWPTGSGTPTLASHSPRTLT